MNRLALLLTAALAVLAIGLAQPAKSAADVTVLQDGNTLTTFKTAKCRRGKGFLKFTASAKSRNGWRMTVDLFSAGRSHNLQYGFGDQVTVKGPGGSFSNLNSPPNAPPGGGAVEFNRSGSRMGVGFSPAFDESISSAVSFAGGVKCQYPKKKKRRRR